MRVMPAINNNETMINVLSEELTHRKHQNLSLLVKDLSYLTNNGDQVMTLVNDENKLINKRKLKIF
jgi:hypothetical protein